MEKLVVIPTYNEKENISNILHAIFNLNQDFHVLVIDDGSPDGTAQIVKELRSKFPGQLFIEERTGKLGLGTAYIHGFRWALENGYSFVFEMDADFSHKPEDLKRLVDAIDQGNDFVIGSRYIRGGSIPADWGIARRLNSKFGNIVTRYIAGMHKVHDCTAGFRVIRADLLSKIDLAGLKVRGYAFQPALLHEALIQGATVKEIPVDFVDRTRGDSKLGLTDIVEFIFHAWWIRLRSLKTFIKFGIVGISGVGVNIGSFTALLQSGMNKYLASPIAIELSIIWNFIINNYWTFRGRNGKGTFGIRGLKFNAVSFVSLAVSYTSFVILTMSFTHALPQVHELVSVVPASVINYFLNSYWTFPRLTSKHSRQ